ncbi:hypothetical protein HOP50_13g70850 [Chloropicon primus]|uniref:Uncharacterized protein n=1 Tax=Chloropicon primus TaxID=1764295 RepID=A0A5B8MVV1_9CHLO|nr:hypothetical protein A3770_13p70650 [Chloropicon primus]UPR03755.1 hypothetical protein HOP50_13g70850 [Chloropicon primus]|eukprot:QDZ24547.1 hypothetical protein A3770_13p70650 [Chloropicon primus]
MDCPSSGSCSYEEPLKATTTTTTMPDQDQDHRPRPLMTRTKSCSEHGTSLRLLLKHKSFREDDVRKLVDYEMLREDVDARAEAKRNAGLVDKVGNWFGDALFKFQVMSGTYALARSEKLAVNAAAASVLALALAVHFYGA